ncbi:MAG TPA: phosphatidate cytidylyltransferase [Paludibacteraceae bacterium]|nr:phosphatidate cytidylyltransferase [Paludibacteraceae bacterium]
MEKITNEFLKRSISAVVYVLLVVASLFISPATFVIVFAFFMSMCIYEFHKIINQQPEVNVPRWLSMGISLLLFLISFFYFSGRAFLPIFSYYIILIFWMFIRELFLKNPNPVHNWAYFLLGQVWIALPFSLLNFIVYFNNYQPLLILSIFILVWMNDTGAYLIGITLGKHKMIPRVSPHKSWEGFAGGILVTLLTGYLLSLWLYQLDLPQWLFMSLIVSIFATFGDLLESLWKRTFQIKDSGNAIPGHGGFLDRFDSLLMVVPAVLIYLIFLFN